MRPVESELVSDGPSEWIAIFAWLVVEVFCNENRQHKIYPKPLGWIVLHSPPADLAPKAGLAFLFLSPYNDAGLRLCECATQIFRAEGGNATAVKKYWKIQIACLTSERLDCCEISAGLVHISCYPGTEHAVAVSKERNQDQIGK